MHINQSALADLAKAILIAFLIPIGSPGTPSLAVPENVMQQQYNQARMWFDNKRFSKAREILIRLCRQPNATPEMRVLLADTYLDADEVDEDSPGLRAAEAGLRIAMRQDPGYGRVYKDLAECCNGRAEYKQAIDLSTKALNAKRPDDNALRQRALAYSHAGKNQEALADIRAYIKTGRTEFFNYLIEGECEQSLKDYHAAELSFRHALAISPVVKSRLLRSLVTCLIAQHKLPEAVKVVSESIEHTPHDADMYELRATLYTQLRDVTAAIADLSKAIEISPTAKYYKERAEIFKTLGRNQEAEEDLKKAEKCNDNTVFF